MSNAYDGSAFGGYVNPLDKLRGPAGPEGQMGPVGAQGPTGVDGVVGPQGPIGPAGAGGAQGSIGPIGPQGAIGSSGAAGQTGAVGSTGAIGPIGPGGPAGTSPIISALANGAAGDGVTDDAPALQAIINNASYLRGAHIYLEPRSYYLSQPLLVRNKPIHLEGAMGANASTRGTGLIVPNGFIRLENADASVIENLYVSGGGANTDQVFVGQGGGTDGSFQIMFQNIRFVSGWRGLTVQGGNSIRFQNVTWGTFAGEQVCLFNGLGDSTNAGPIEFLQCGIGPNNATTDCLVFDGLSGSAKFVETYFGAGRHGLWIKNTTGGTDASFFYILGGGSENCQGHAVLAENGAHFVATGFYASVDGDYENFRFKSGWKGVRLGTGEIRGSGRDGIRADCAMTLTGCDIINNGRCSWDLVAVAVASTQSNGGLVRIITTTAHGYATGDVANMTGVQDITTNTEHGVTVINAVTLDVPGSVWTTNGTGGSLTRNAGGIATVADNGATIARLGFGVPHQLRQDDIVRVSGVVAPATLNGDWKVAVIDTTHVDLVGSVYASGYTSGGVARRLGYAARFMPGASGSTWHGGLAGTDGSGVNRQDYGIYNEAATITVTGVDATGNTTGRVNDVSGSRFARFINNPGDEYTDFVLRLKIDGTVANGDYLPMDLFWMVQRKFRVVRVIRKLSAGTCSIKLSKFNGTVVSSLAGSSNVTATTAYTATALSTNYIVDGGATGEFQPRISVSAVAGATDLMVEFRCQTFSG